MYGKGREGTETMNKKHDRELKQTKAREDYAKHSDEWKTGVMRV